MERLTKTLDVARGLAFLCSEESGAMVGLWGALSVWWIRTTSPVGNQLFTIQVISAVTVGGAALSGGAVSVYGTIVAAFILGMLSTGLIMMGAIYQMNTL